jgi:endonuclease/exonuclease/phosphatase family metal-dependent hydrolase
VRIATFNLENLDDRPPGGIEFADRLAVLRPQLQRLRADILCLQEVNAREPEEGAARPRALPALDRLLRGTAYEGYGRVVSSGCRGMRAAGDADTRPPGPADRHNLTILSRYPVLESRQVWHDLMPPPAYRSPSGAASAGPADILWDRPLLHAVLGLADGRRLHVVAVHLRAPRAAFLPGRKTPDGSWERLADWAEGFFAATVKAAGQALETRLVVDQIFDAEPDALIAVCGDFNAGDGEAPLRLVAGDEEDSGNGRLAARALVVLDRGLSDSRRFSVVHNGRRVMLDHILVSRPLSGWYLGAEIHNETLGDELVSPLRVRMPPDSYHAPLVAAFEPP